MLLELVRTKTRDDIRLEAAFHAATGSTQDGMDGYIVVHGTGGNFYSSTMLENLAAALHKRGAAVLRINTRGHDAVSTAATSRGGTRLGAAYEIVDDCRHDLAAWTDWLRERAGPRIALVGHSLGAVKCIYAAAHEASVAPTCVIALSPPRLAYSWFCESAKRDEFLQTYRRAEEMVNAGDPAALIDARFPLPFLITAAGYVEKYGPDERYHYLPLLRRVRQPMLFTFGSIEVENNVAFMQSPEALTSLGLDRVAVRTIAGADHFYTGVHAALIEAVESWLSESGSRAT